jgi:RNA recognition motif-containing protein
MKNTCDTTQEQQNTISAKFASPTSFPASPADSSTTPGSDNTSIKNNSSSNSADCGPPEKLVIKRKVYIRNIEWSVHENMLQRFLAKYGQVKRCSILRDEFTTKSEGFGYAEFMTDEDCERMMNAQPEELVLNGRQLDVCQYKEETNKNKVIRGNK